MLVAERRSEKGVFGLWILCTWRGFVDVQNVWIRPRQMLGFPTNVDKTWDPLKTNSSKIITVN